MNLPTPYAVMVETKTGASLVQVLQQQSGPPRLDTALALLEPCTAEDIARLVNFGCQQSGADEPHRRLPVFQPGGDVPQQWRSEVRDHGRGKGRQLLAQVEPPK